MKTETIELKELKFHQKIWSASPRGCPKDLVVKFACEAVGVTEQAFHSKTKKREAAMARQIAMTYVCANRYTKRMSLREIGEIFGGRDHATVLHAKRTVHELLISNIEMKRCVKIFLQKITEYSHEYSTIMNSDEWSHKKKVKLTE